jgi:hypothetical protein
MHEAQSPHKDTAGGLAPGHNPQENVRATSIHLETLDGGPLAAFESWQSRSNGQACGSSTAGLAARRHSAPRRGDVGWGNWIGGYVLSSENHKAQRKSRFLELKGGQSRISLQIDISCMIFN